MSPPRPLATVRTLAGYWWVLVPYTAALGLVVRVIAASFGDQSPPTITNDGGFFLYSGVAMAGGRLPYLTLWDVKPPAIHETVALAALATGGDRGLVYLLTTGLTAVIVVVSCTLLAAAVYEMTGSELGGFVAGIAPLAYPTNYLLVPSGVRPKYFVVLFGLVAIYLVLVRRPYLAGLAGGLAASYWQPGIVFAAAAVGAFAVDDGALGWTERTRTAAAGVASAAVVVLVPFVLGGGLPQLFDQVVVTPLVVSDGGGVIGNFRSLLDAFGSTWIVPVLGLFGVGSVLARADSPETNPRLAVLVAPVGWFVLVALVDFDGFADAIPLAFLSGLGAGVYVGQSLTAVSRLPRDRRLGVVLAVLVVGSAVLALPWVERSDPDVGAGPAEQFGNAYLNGVEFHVCHVRLSSVERDWIRRYGADRSARRCPVSWLSGDPG